MIEKYPYPDFPFEIRFQYQLWYRLKVSANLGFSFLNQNSGFGHSLLLVTGFEFGRLEL